MRWTWTITWSCCIMFWLLAAQDTRCSEMQEGMARDAAVLEAVLVDLISHRDSPIEKKGEIQFSADALRKTINADIILQGVNDTNVTKLSAEHKRAAHEAALSLVQRAEKGDVFKAFVPADDRIKIYSAKHAQSDPRVDLLRRPQVFTAYSPGYSRDQKVSLVTIYFPWSRHGGTATYVLTKDKEKWKVIFSELVVFQ